MNICIFTGARPNFIKVAPLLRAIEGVNHFLDSRSSSARLQSEAAQELPLPKQGGTGRVSLNARLVYAGSENDPTLESSLFDDLSIKKPDVFLGVECENLNELTGQVMAKFEQYLQQHPTDVVVVVDDLASTMAAAIVTKKQGIRLVHIAAGTRSFDISMPKEINRLVIDGLSDILFTAGISNNSIANKEGAELSKVYMVGNILIDNIRYNQSRFVRPAILDTLDSRLSNREALRLQRTLNPQPYIVFTLNRKVLIQDKENLKAMLEAMVKAAGDMPILAPLRGQAKEVVEEIAKQLPQQDSLTGANHTLQLVPPLGYLEFCWLTAHAKGIITDSGNVAEEATFNGVPCITLNSYTEHIETVKVGSNVLVGEDATKLGEAVCDMVGGKWKTSAIPDRWDGRTAERILQIICNS